MLRLLITKQWWTRPCPCLSLTPPPVVIIPVWTRAVAIVATESIMQGNSWPTKSSSIKTPSTTTSTATVTEISLASMPNQTITRLFRCSRHLCTRNNRTSAPRTLLRYNTKRRPDQWLETHPLHNSSLCYSNRPSTLIRNYLIFYLYIYRNFILNGVCAICIN